MTISLVLDVILLVVLAGYLLHGYRSGLLLSLGGLVGIAAGAVAAFFAAPLVNQAMGSNAWRIPVVLLAAVVLLGIGHAAGSAVGRILRRGVNRTPLRIIDRIAGAVVDVVVAALVLSMLAFGIGSLGIPALTTAIGSSGVLRTIDTVTPPPVKAGMAQLRALVVNDATGRVIALAAPDGPTDPPHVATDTAALQRAARSVVKVTGVAFACSQTQSGSGFVVAPDRIVTNAHVVAGVGQPVVQAPDGQTATGRVVYFDPTHDLAVIAVDGLTARALPLAPALKAGDRAVFDGYPLGGPFRSAPAAVRSIGPQRVQDIYKQRMTTMPIYSLAADVEQGNSGGPLLTLGGRVAGVIFATNANGTPVGYALGAGVLDPVAHAAESHDATVDSGHCTRE